MQTRVSLCVFAVLCSVLAAHSHKGPRGLSCVNDFVSNISCTWGRSPGAPGAPGAPRADCWIFAMKTTRIFKDYQMLPDTIIRSCKLKQHRDATSGCTLVFENVVFTPLKNMSYIRVECNGTMVENLTDYPPYRHIKMRPPGVPNVSITANETRVSWSLGSPPSDYLTSLHFELQIKQKIKSRNETNTLSSSERELSIPAGQLQGHCQVRVRVKPIIPGYDSHWSNWGPTTSFLGATDMATPSQDQGLTSLVMWGVLLSVGIVIVTLVLYRSCAIRRLLKGKPVPNPSKYFHTLHPVHGGNLKKWLNPLSASESFFTAQPGDRISPVEICETCDVVPSTSPSSSSTSALLHSGSDPSARSHTSGVVHNSSSSSSSSSSSCFSNKGYFMSSSASSSAWTDPNPAYFTYQEDFHNVHNSLSLRLSFHPSLDYFPTYESLKREPQSPDSGFGIGKEDEDKRFVRVEENEVSDDDPPLLILPLHLPSQMCPTSSAPPPPTPPTPPLIPSDSQQVEVPVAAAAGGSCAAWPLAGAMCRSSSMPVEPCKTGYLTLKELQATFSNKSI